MIEVAGVTKRFGKFTAIEDISLVVEDGSVYGLVGYNGAGKTTLLKIIAGVYRADAGYVRIGEASDAEPVHTGEASDAEKVRTSEASDAEPVHTGEASDAEPARECLGSSDNNSLFIVADEPYFLPQATPEAMRSFYRGYYPHWSDDVYERLLALFSLDPTAKVVGFSKGMQRQLGILLGFATGAKTMLLDESFDGLDLGKRNLLKRLLRLYAQKRNAAVILSSHNLRELEDAADCLGMIKGSTLVFDGSVESVHKRYPGASLEEIFLSEGKAPEDIEGIFG